ncbi:hypothetical protein LY474_26435 [Myxococcus stipitatus]|uniref:hypothetical protein n=1 Tax=Myxococcus stipitatus TaxID=83455 RepID=UPI001F482C57|nr:hypothetical protein [Myxococcus stipitatus]MCE9671349.1 hypothetical protein [Myxococcus stipitatus]
MQRLVGASALYARQQWERIYYGGDEEYDEVARENRQVISKVLPVIEQLLDEDLLEQLDAGAFPGSSLTGFSLPNPFKPSTWGSLPGPWNWLPRPSWSLAPARPRKTAALSTRSARPGAQSPSPTRVTVLLDQLLEDFRTDVLERLRKVRREDRALNDSDLDELVKGFREELGLVARRSKQRKARQDEEDDDT